MRWNLRMKAAERGIWKSTEMRRLLAESGVGISAGKMSQLWTGNPNIVRLDELDVICSILDCEPSDLLIREPHKVAEQRPDPQRTAAATRSGTPAVAPVVAPRLGNRRSTPPL